MSFSPELGLIFAICAVSGCVQGMMGFGFGLVAMSALPLAMDAQQAGILVVLLTALVTLRTFHFHRMHFTWSEAKWLIGSSAVGAMIGALFLVHADAGVFRKSLGAALLLMGLYDLFLGQRRQIRCPKWLAVPLGTSSGILGGAFNMGGPPAVIFLYSQGWSRGRAIATLQVTFLTTVLVRIVTISASRMFSWDIMKLGLGSALPCFLGLWAGHHFGGKIAKEKFQIGISIFLTLIALNYLLG